MLNAERGMGRTWVTLLGVAALALALFAPACRAALAAPAAQTHGDIQMLESLTGEQFERAWLSMMIQHHEGAIEMARLAADRAAHQEIKTIADSITQSQSREIDQMTGWLAQWYGATPGEGMMHGPMTNMTMMLETLSGDPFDKAFLRVMHDHHRGALEMSELVPQRAVHEELKELARNIITSQEAEIQQFMAWAQSWYGIDLMVPEEAGPGMPRSGAGDLIVWLWGWTLASALILGIGLAMRRRARPRA